VAGEAVRLLPADLVVDDLAALVSEPALGPSSASGGRVETSAAQSNFLLCRHLTVRLGLEFSIPIVGVVASVTIARVVAPVPIVGVIAPVSIVGVVAPGVAALAAVAVGVLLSGPPGATVRLHPDSRGNAIVAVLNHNGPSLVHHLDVGQWNLPEYMKLSYCTELFEIHLLRPLKLFFRNTLFMKSTHIFFCSLASFLDAPAKNLGSN
jgi:hypothetical protein